MPDAMHVQMCPGDLCQVSWTAPMMAYDMHGRQLFSHFMQHCTLSVLHVCMITFQFYAQVAALLYLADAFWKLCTDQVHIMLGETIQDHEVPSSHMVAD